MRQRLRLRRRSGALRGEQGRCRRQCDPASRRTLTRPICRSTLVVLRSHGELALRETTGHDALPMVGANRWCACCGLAALMLTACGDPGSGSPQTVTSTSLAMDEVVISTVAEQTLDTQSTDGHSSPRGFYLRDADPASVPVIRLPSDSGDVEARVGPRPDGGAGLCVVDAFGAFPGRVACFEPDADGRLFVPLLSEGQPSVFIDDRVARVTVHSDVDAERDLRLIDVPDVPGARITQGTSEVDADLNATITFYDESHAELIGAEYRPPRP